ncbi:hypothetical protein [Floricoccus penangensis]|uniref:hypothetical protein n=1 Tax=Floricoccus penangensis TaxID=1859475 RepID=UPI00203D7E06|nr:hypothetical protein [Floricoccus penangensis]URZ86545.1 hypothetical protein KIW23_05425 [Floricoccus penangensis]
MRWFLSFVEFLINNTRNIMDIMVGIITPNVISNTREEYGTPSFDKKVITKTKTAAKTDKNSAKIKTKFIFLHYQSSHLFLT